MEGPLVLGIAAAQHNGAACLMRGDAILAAIQEERVTRLKRQGIGGARPSAAVAYCLDAASVSMTDLDLIVLCTQTARSRPEHDVSVNQQLVDISRLGKVRFVSHHRGHALSVLAWSGFEDAAILVADGLGSPWEDMQNDERRWAVGAPAGASETISLYRARGWDLEVLGKQFAPDANWLAIPRSGFPQFQSLGGMYSAFAHKIFGDELEAGKVMGLASFAEPQIAVDRFLSLSEAGVAFTNDLPPKVRDMRSNAPSDTMAKIAAASVQAALEAALLHLAQRLRIATGSPNLGFAGGVALNAIANERLLRNAGFERLQVIPAADDGGTAFGAAVHGLLELGYHPKRQQRKTDAYGRVYTDADILDAASEFPRVHATRQDDIAAATAEELAKGRICGWFQGGSEFGPRALGCRSILADPRSCDTKHRLDASVKHRESFRPYAPSVLLSDAASWFDTGPELESPFMLRVVEVRGHVRHRIPAVVHVDGTARLQTVCEEDGAYYRLLHRFRALTGIPVILNTSFNARGAPIVETPFDALEYFSRSGLDFCSIGHWLFEK